MPFKITEKDTYLQIDWFGIITSEDLAGIGQDIPRFMRKNHSLVNVLHAFDKVVGCSYTPIEAYAHSLKNKAMRIPIRSKSASISTNEETYKYAKLFQELNRNPNLEMEIFASEKEALDWFGA